MSDPDTRLGRSIAELVQSVPDAAESEMDLFGGTTPVLCAYSKCRKPFHAKRLGWDENGEPKFQAYHHRHCRRMAWEEEQLAKAKQERISKTEAAREKALVFLSENFSIELYFVGRINDDISLGKKKSNFRRHWETARDFYKVEMNDHWEPFIKAAFREKYPEIAHMIRMRKAK